MYQRMRRVYELNLLKNDGKDDLKRVVFSRNQIPTKKELFYLPQLNKTC